MAHKEVFNVRMNVQDTPSKNKKEIGALFGMMRDVVNTHSMPEYPAQAFRVIVVALEDPLDPYLCPHCTPRVPCDVHVDFKPQKEADDG